MMTETMELIVNGKPQALPEGSTVSQLLETLKIKAERVVVEVNLKILKRHEQPATVLKAGDQVEIVRFVGGGAVGEGWHPAGDVVIVIRDRTCRRNHS